MNTVTWLVVFCDGTAHVEAREGNCTTLYSREAGFDWTASQDGGSRLEVTDDTTLVFLETLIDWTP